MLSWGSGWSDISPLTNTRPAWCWGYPAGGVQECSQCIIELGVLIRQLVLARAGVVVSVVFWGMHCADTHHSVGGSCLDMPVQRNITLSCRARAAGKCWTSWPWVTWRMFCALRIYISATSTHVYDDHGVTQLCKKCFMKIHLHVKKTIHFM